MTHDDDFFGLKKKIILKIVYFMHMSYSEKFKDASNTHIFSFYLKKKQ